MSRMSERCEPSDGGFAYVRKDGPHWRSVVYVYMQGDSGSCLPAGTTTHASWREAFDWACGRIRGFAEARKAVSA